MLVSLIEVSPRAAFCLPPLFGGTAKQFPCYQGIASLAEVRLVRTCTCGVSGAGNGTTVRVRGPGVAGGRKPWIIS
jgi:hypothetical protein